MFQVPASASQYYSYNLKPLVIDLLINTADRLCDSRPNRPFRTFIGVLMSIDIPAFLKAFANFKSLNPNPEIRPRLEVN